MKERFVSAIFEVIESIKNAAQAVGSVRNFFNAPENILTKAPSAALYEGQTDEKEMGISYEKIDNYLLNHEGEKEDIELIDKAFKRSAHKRRMPAFYKETDGE